MKLRKLFAIMLAAALALSFAACGSAALNDGTYEGQSSVYEGDDDGSGAGYGVVKITITDGKVTAAEFNTYEPDGTLKDEDYGKQNGEIANTDFYTKAQRAVQASAKYAEQLAAKGSLDEVDAISGATISYNEFTEAVNAALDKAQGK